MTTSSLPANLLLAEEIPKNYPSSVNFEDWIVIYQLVKYRYATPDQMPTIYSMQEVVSLPILSVYRFLLAKNTSFKSGDFQTLLCLLISFFLTKDLTCSLLENCRRKKTISLLSTDLHLQTATIAIANGKDKDETAFQNLDCSMVVFLCREILHTDCDGGEDFAVSLKWKPTLSRQRRSCSLHEHRMIDIKLRKMKGRIVGSGRGGHFKNQVSPPT
ncbi:hypothetical protein D5086_015841 [Populus alba]|uniref:Uncharacterized protein n=1 Tax=Populus alba TaxID=43335 RepID=A0ACC4BSN0_POPAL